ncbi:MAG TPA: DUF3307 domain-containing protein [Tetragenococcus sp.]|nr:DUF3307 domain-containing protein [Tetragenococcus sp.]
MLFLSLFNGHLLADFYFQTTKMAQEKEHSLKYLLLHCLIYGVTMLIVCLPILNKDILPAIVMVSLIHLMIDCLKAFITTHYPLTESQHIIFYCFDQFLHLSTIFYFAFAMNFSAELSSLSLYFPFDLLSVLAWSSLLLFVGKPASITVRKVLDHFDPQTPDEGIKNAGTLIGILERLIILLLLSANQYGAIGFVLTAKSVARYNKISEDPQFAEYYLLGTLLSTLLVIGCFQFIFKGVLA